MLTLTYFFTEIQIQFGMHSNNKLSITTNIYYRKFIIYFCNIVGFLVPIVVGKLVGLCSGLASMHIICDLLWCSSCIAAIYYDEIVVTLRSIVT